MPTSPRSEARASVSERVIESVAEATDTSPIEIDPPLYHIVDPDALDALFQPNRETDIRVTFEYYGCDVTVSSHGVIDVERTPNRSVIGAQTGDGIEQQEVD